MSKKRKTVSCQKHSSRTPRTAGSTVSTTPGCYLLVSWNISLRYTRQLRTDPYPWDWEQALNHLLRRTSVNKLGEARTLHSLICSNPTDVTPYSDAQNRHLLSDYRLRSPTDLRSQDPQNRLWGPNLQVSGSRATMYGEYYCSGRAILFCYHPDWNTGYGMMQL